ncbi:MAG: SpaA isopeptide-forming pilin-related protein [Acutalibacteraceae bacterium]
MKNNGRLLSMLKRRRTVFLTMTALILTVALTTLALMTGFCNAVLSPDDASAANLPDTAGAAVSDTDDLASGVSVLGGYINSAETDLSTPRAYVTSNAGNAQCETLQSALALNENSVMSLAAEPEGDYFAVTYKIHGYCGTDDHPLQVTFGGSSYDDNLGNGLSNSPFTVSDGTEITRYALKTANNRNYALKQNSPYSTIESYRIYATDNPREVYTDEESESYKNFITQSKFSGSVYVRFTNTSKVNITIEVTYGKSYNTIYASTPNPLNEYSTNVNYTFYGNIISGSSTTSSRSITVNGSNNVLVKPGDEFRIRTSDSSNRYYEIRNLKAYKRASDGTKGEEIPLTLSTEKTSYNGYEEYTFTMPEDSDIIFEADAVYYHTFVNFKTDGKLFFTPSDMAPTIVPTNGGVTVSNYNNTLGASHYISAGYEYQITYKDTLNRSSLIKGVLTYTDLDGNAQEKTYEAVDGVITFTLPYVMKPAPGNQTVFTLYCDESNLKNLEIATDTIYKGYVKLSDAAGENSISRYDQRGTSGFNAYTQNSLSYQLSSKSYTYYDLCAGREYKLEDIYTSYQGKRLVFSGAEIFKKDADGNVTDEEVQVTDNGDGTYSFVMPECDIQLKPLYYDKLHQFTMENNQTGFGATVTAPADSTDGLSYIFSNNSLGGNPNPQTSVTLAANSIRTFQYILEDGTYTLTHQLTNDSAYRVKSVKLYKPYVNSSGGIYSYIYKSNGEILNQLYEDEIQAQAITDNGDGTYTIKVPDSFAENQVAIIYTEFEYYTENYADIHYTVTRNNFNAAPSTALKGYFEDTVGVANKSYSYNSAQDLTLSALKNQEIEFTLNGSNYQAVYLPLTVTVTNAETGDVVAKVKYLNEDYEFVEGSEGDFLSAPETTYVENSDGSKTKNKIVFKMSFADYPIDLKVETDNAYAPLIINQYKVDSDGNVSPVSDSDGFSTKIQAAIHKSSSDVSVDRHPELHSKFFTEDGSSYNQGFDVNGASYSCKYIVPTGIDIGKVTVSAIPTAAEGYIVSDIKAVALDRFGTEVKSTSYDWYSPTKAGWKYTAASSTYGTDGNSYLCSTGIRSDRHNPSEQLVINVYYSQKSSLTVNQIIEDFVDESSSTELANVKVSDYNEPRENLTTFSSDDKGVVDTLTYSISGRKDHTKVDEVYTWTNTCGVTQGTGIKLAITPKGARNIKNVTAYKLVDGEKQELASTLISGTGFPGSETVYQLDNAVSVGDDIYVDITYGSAQTLKVDVRMLNSSNDVVANTTNVSVKVTGTVTTGTEEAADTKAFLRDGETERIDSFTTSVKDSVYAYSNTKIAVDTTLDDSGYVIANVLAYEMNDSGKEITTKRLNLSTRKIEAGDTELQSAAIDLSHCEMSSLPVGKNTIIVVYLAKKSTMKVSVYTANDAGEYELGNNTGDSGSYINISGNNSLIGYNPYTIVTSTDEGNYNTDSFTLTNDPPSRTTSILQGSRISAFAQLPYDADYVVSKIVVRYKNSEGKIVKDTSAYCNSIYTYTDSITQVKYLRVNFGSHSWIMPNRDDYDIGVYLIKAKQVHSKVVLNSADGTSTRGDRAGSVTMYGKNNVDPEVTAPFSTNASSSYDAIKVESPFVKSVKCVRGTELSFKVRTASQNFYIGRVSAKLGSEDGTTIKLTESEPDKNGYITYTLVNRDGSNYTMPSLNDVYINVVFEAKSTSTINIDYTYTDDYRTFKPITDDIAEVVISGTNSIEAFKGLPVITDSTGAQADSFTLESGQGTATYTALAGSNIKVGASYIEGHYYIPYKLEVTDAQSQTVSKSAGYGTESCTVSLNGTIAEKTYNIKVVLVPASLISIKQYENNRYGDTPENVLLSNRVENMQKAKLTAVNPDFSTPLAKSSALSDSFTASPNSETYLVAIGTTFSITFNNNTAAPGYLKAAKFYKDTADVSESLVKQSEEDGIVTYNFDGDITADSIYSVQGYYDCIDLFIKTNYSPVNVYLMLSDENDGRNVDVNNPDTYKEKILLRDMSSAQNVLQRVVEDYKTMTGKLYFILEKNTSNEDVALRSATWYDYRDKITRDIKNTLVENIYTREVNGITKYYYWYQATPVYESSTPIDNTMDFEIAFTTEKPPVNPNPPSKPTEAKVTVTQFERTSNTGYVETTNGKTVVSLANSSEKFTYNGSEVSSFEVPVDAGSGVLLSSASALTKTGQTVVLDVTPPDKYIVSKVEVITDSGTAYTATSKNGVYKIAVNSGIVNINVYFSQPLVTISTNNTASDAKGTVAIGGSEIIGANEFMDSTLVNAGDSKTLVVSPLNYTKDGVEYQYHVSYVLMGNERNNMSLIDPALISTDPDTGVSTITLGNISGDVDIHIQFAGEGEEQTALLVVSHHIKISDEYEDSVYGKVITTGTLTGNDAPIYLSGEPCSSFTLTDQKTLTTTVVAGTSLDFDVTPPDNYEVDKIEGTFTSSDQSATGEALVFTQNGSKYTLNNTMSDSGVIYVDVYYSIPVVTNELTVAKKVDASNLNSGLVSAVNAKLANSNFGFIIQQNGSALGNKDYTLTNADSTQESKTTDASGVFALKPDCIALFCDIFNYNDTVVISENVPAIFSFDTSYLLKDLVADKTLDTGNSATASFSFVNNEQSKLKDTKLAAEFINAISVANVTLDKSLYKSDGTTPSDKEVAFDFTVELDLDGDGTEYDYQQYDLEYKVTSGGEESADTYTANGGTLSITPSQTAKLINIPVGADFRITEASKTGYEPIGTNEITGVIGTDNAQFSNKTLTASKGLSAVKYLDGNAYSNGSDFNFNAKLIDVTNIPDVTSKEQTELDSLKTSQAYTSTVGTTGADGSVVFTDFTSDLSDDEAARYVFEITEQTPNVAGKYSVDSTVYYAYIDISNGAMSAPMYSDNKALSDSSAEAPKFYNTTSILYTDILFTKLDESGQPLGGSQFTLYTDESCEKVATKENVSKTDSTFTNPAESSSADGEVAFSEVRYNPTSGATYYFKETKATNGYQLIGGTFRVDIDTDGRCSISYKSDADVEYKPLADSSVTNIKQPELPLAGGTGTTMFYILGTIAVLGAAAAFVLYRKRSLVIGFAKRIFRSR